MAGAIGFKVKVNFNKRPIAKAAKNASERNLFRAAASVSVFTKRSLKKTKTPSRPGTPPTVGAKPFFIFNDNRVTPEQAEKIKKRGGTIKKQTGKGAGRLRKSIAFNVNKTRLAAIIGAKKSIVGLAGHVHEFGGEFRGKKFPKRPFQLLALIKTSENEKIAKFWKDTIRAI